MQRQLKGTSVFAAVLILMLLTGCTSTQTGKATVTPTGTITVLPVEATNGVDVGQPATGATAQTTLEDQTPTVAETTPTADATMEPSSAANWMIIVNDSKSKDNQGVAIVYDLVMLVENPLGTSSNASGTYTGTVMLQQSMDASQLNNSALSFAGGFNVIMTGESVSFELMTYNWDTYVDMGNLLEYQVLAPLVENPYAYATVAQIPMQGSGTLNPSAQGIGGESAGVNESASGSGGVTFDITIAPDGTVIVVSPTVPVVFKGVLVSNGDPADPKKTQAEEKIKEMMSQAAGQ